MTDGFDAAQRAYDSLLPPDEQLMCSCESHPIRFEGDICEDCAWDIHDQLDGAEDDA